MQQRLAGENFGRGAIVLKSGESFSAFTGYSVRAIQWQGY
jgi:hypothetical protein